MSETRPKVLATDLDGTLIPLPNQPGQATDLVTLCEDLRRSEMQLVFVTGRHLESVQQAISEFNLPRPDWIICDVGTTLIQVASDSESALQKSESELPNSKSSFVDGSTSVENHYFPLRSNKFDRSEAYENHLRVITQEYSLARLSDRLSSIEGLRRQETEKQGLFKLSYYTQAELLTKISDHVKSVLFSESIPYSLISSRDPFNQDGLIDLLPMGVSKAYALNWWCQMQSIEPDEIIFAGDSGNDLAALTAGYRSIIVANAAPELIQQVKLEHSKQGWQDRLFVASKSATSGVLQGTKHYLQ